MTRIKPSTHSASWLVGHSVSLSDGLVLGQNEVSCDKS